MLNLLEVKPGEHVRLKGGAVCEVVENVGDGIWLQLRSLSHSTDASQVGAEELVHCEEIVGVVEDART